MALIELLHGCTVTGDIARVVVGGLLYDPVPRRIFLIEPVDYGVIQARRICLVLKRDQSLVIRLHKNHGVVLLTIFVLRLLAEVERDVLVSASWHKSRIKIWQG